MRKGAVLYCDRAAPRELCAVSRAERQHANVLQMALLAIGNVSVGADLGKEPLALLRG